LEKNNLEMKFSKKLDLSYADRALAFFFIFLAANLLLAYIPMSFSMKGWAFVLGLLLPLGVAFYGLEHKVSEKLPCSRESFTVSSPWPLVLVLFLAVGIRLAQVHVPDYWPLWDDGCFASYSMGLSNQWKWDFFYSTTQHPPLFNWSLGLFFKLITPSLFSLWLYPALCSILVIPFAYFATRTFFSKSFSFLFCFMVGLGFWPLYAGRFCMYMVVLLLWEMITLALLAVFLKVGPSSKRFKILPWLGFCLAAGFWIAIAWPVVALVVLAAVYHHSKSSPQGRKNFLLWVLIPLLVSVAIFIVASVLEKNGAHIQALWAFGPGFDWKRQFLDSLSNLTALFWGCDLQDSYGPVWGGALNPVLGSFFFIGLLEAYRRRHDSLVRWMAASFFLLLVPGLVCRNFDLFRNTQVLPFLFWISAFGAQALLLGTRTKGLRALVFLALILSVPMDLRHLWLTYHSPPFSPGAGFSQPATYSRAYHVLKSRSEKLGKGVILFDLKPNVADQTLAVATYAFNAARNPEIRQNDIHWVAIVVDVHYRPFLVKRFPKGEWVPLFPEDGIARQSQDTLMLGILPLEPSDREWVSRWMGADQAFWDIVWQAANIPAGQKRDAVFQRLSGAAEWARGDRLLESLYWEMVFDFHRWENVYGDKNVRVHYPASREAISQALQRGYPTAQFYNEWGSFLTMEKNDGEARKAFEKAARSEVNYTSAAENLKALERMKKTRSGR
jgi:hypothetical protein